MGLPVLILGFSGSGKTTSLRNFGAEELALVNVNGKYLPFRGRFSQQLVSDNTAEIANFIKSAKAKVIAVDDSQYIMVNEFMRRAKETGYQKFTDIGKNFWDLVSLVRTLPEDVIVYFLNHIETGDDGRQKVKTVGKLLDEKTNIEGMFTIVLKTVVMDGKYFFATQTDGADPCKSPMGLFDKVLIPNDLKMVDETIRTYYGLVPEHFCADCGAVIMPTSKRSAKELADASTAKFGRILCAECAKAVLADSSETPAQQNFSQQGANAE